jgi:hypothetical protein
VENKLRTLEAGCWLVADVESEFELLDLGAARAMKAPTRPPERFVPPEGPYFTYTTTTSVTANTATIAALPRVSPIRFDHV